MEKVVVTGGLGLIGSSLIEYFIEKTSYEILLIDNLSTGNRSNLSKIEDSVDERLWIKIMDVTRPDNDEIFEFNPTVIYHLASRASPTDFIKYPIDILKTNSVGTYNMLEIARLCQSKFILASTSEIYGNPKIHPQTENYYGNVNPIGLRSCYDEGKRFAEALTAAYHRKFDLNTVIVRLFNTYGPRLRKNDGRVISTFIHQALNDLPITIYGDGTQTRSFCHVNDIVEGLIQIGKSDKTNGGIFNLGSPEEIAINDLANLIISLSGSDSSIIFQNPKFEDEPQNRKPDITKIQSIINWYPRNSLEKGLKHTIESVQNQ